MWWTIATALAGSGADLLADPGGISSGGRPDLLDPVVGGETTEDFEDVVALAGIDDAGEVAVFCSGSLIEKRWVLTAAHCITEGKPEYERYGYDMFVLFGSDIVGDGYLQAIPWAYSEAFSGYNPNAFTDDLGLVQLDRPKLGTQIMVLNDTPPDDSWIGEDLTFVGFGITSDYANDAGTKRDTSFPLTDYDDSNLMAGDPALQTNVCNGDSGGATLRTTDAGYELVGINAFVTPSCVRGTEGSTRVDPHIDWIRELVPHAITEPRDIQPDSAGAWDLGVTDPTVGLDGYPQPSGNFEPGCAHVGGGSGVPLVGGLVVLLRKKAAKKAQ